MNQSPDHTTSDRAPNLAARARVAFIQACWHRDIVDAGRDAFVAELGERAGDSAEVDVFEVPGSLEIPLQAKRLAQSGRYDLIVAAGFVVDGGIYRHEFVAQAVLDGIMRVQLDSEVPILSMVLTPQRFHESEEHIRFFREHMPHKGREAAAACVQVLGDRGVGQSQSARETIAA